MKVTGQQPSVVKDLKTTQTQGKDQFSSNSEVNQAGASGSSIKTSSFILDKMKTKINVEPEVRTDQVAELKAKIAKGEYQIDFQDLATKMLKDSLIEDRS